jgi:hypothetical protein
LWTRARSDAERDLDVERVLARPIMPKYFPGSSVCNCSGVFRTGVNLTLSQLWLSLSFSHQNNLVLFLVLGDALRIITFHQTLCALPGFVFFFTHICILPTYEHCSITVPALYAHTVRLLHDYCAITVRLLCDYCAITVLYLLSFLLPPDPASDLSHHRRIPHRPTQKTSWTI